MAIEEINAKGGVQGRELKLLFLITTTIQESTVVACIDKKVHAISNAFTLRLFLMDTSAKWKALIYRKYAKTCY